MRRRSFLQTTVAASAASAVFSHSVAEAAPRKSATASQSFAAPGRSVGFGCGHPQWGASTDSNHKIERRPQWPDSGHTQTTLDFHREAFAAEAGNLLGIFAGHIHRQSVDVVNNIPQFVTDANAVGAFMDVRFVPSA